MGALLPDLASKGIGSSSSTRIWRVTLTSGDPPWRIDPGSMEDRAAALEVRNAVYCEELGHRWESPADEFDDRAHLCVVRDPSNLPIASVRILGPEGRPFEIETFLDLSQVLPKDSRAAEMNRFAILPPHRKISSSVHLALFKFSMDLAALERFSHFVLATKAQVAPIYRYLGFEQVPGYSFAHRTLGNDRHDLFLLSLREMLEKFKRTRHPLLRLVTTPGPSS
jgi:hypothetical protein